MAKKMINFLLNEKKDTVMENRNYDPSYLSYGHIFKENQTFKLRFMQ